VAEGFLRSKKIIAKAMAKLIAYITTGIFIKPTHSIDNNRKLLTSSVKL
jgi:hypothetical protein